MEYTGERFIPGIEDYQTVSAHLHRYMSVRSFVEGLVVADIASGEGYGSSILAEGAKYVYGIDIDEEAILYAQQKYQQNNLEFRQGSIDKIPISAHSIDVVISFETIEHVGEYIQIDFMKEIKRILKPDGVLIISTPNKKNCSDRDGGINTFHVKEFYFDEFKSFLQHHFNNIEIYSHNFEWVSVINGGENEGFRCYQNGLSQYTYETPDDTMFFIALCSDIDIANNQLNSTFVPGSREIVKNLIKWGNDQEVLLKEKEKRIEELATWGQNQEILLNEKNLRINELAMWGRDQENLLNKNKKQIEELSKWGDNLEILLGEKNEQIEEILTQNNIQKNEIQTLHDRVEKLEQEKMELNSNWNKRLSERENILQTKCHEIENLLKIKEALQSIADQREKELLNIRSNKIYQQLVKVYKWMNKLRSQKGTDIKNTVVLPDIQMKTTPLISVIIPVYNNAVYLEQCFESIRMQTYENIEIIIVDDCSTDSEVRNILCKYEKYPNFHIYHNDINSGICETTNSAMCKASGEWFAFLDCDDWLDKYAIEKMYNCLKNKPGAIFGYSNRYNFNDASGAKQEVDFRYRPTIEYEKNLHEGMYTSHLKMIHRTAFVKVGLFDSNFNGTQDYDISLKIAHYFGDEAFSFLPEPVYYHRVHEKQTTAIQNENMMMQTYQLQKNAEIRMNIREGQYDRKISIIVLSFNKVEQTIECIDAIRKTVAIPYEIIIWDNKSNEKTIDILKEKIEPFPEVTVIYSERNLGCGGGRRKALTYATGDYIVFLDNDIVVLDGWLTELIVRLESDKKVAAVNCKVIFPDQKVQINSLHYVIDEPFITFSLGGANALASDLSTCQWKENDWINGGATIYRKEILELIEGLEEYPNSFEDNEASIQIKKMGYVLLNSPASIVIHNHINYVNTEKIEREYMEARYNQNNLIVSAAVFYRRNGLIINDPYIFRLMGIEDQDRTLIRQKFDELI